MAITSSYLVAVGKLGKLLESVQNAQAPERFTTKFLEGLGYKSTNDRLFIGLLKSLGFLDANGIPQQRYFNYLDENQSKNVLAEGIQEAYEDLFRVNKNAQDMSQEQVKGKLKSLTQGQYTDAVLNNMARTFIALVKYADFETAKPKVISPDQPSKEMDREDEVETEESVEPSSARRNATTRRLIDSVAYRIEVTLPATRDKAIYDAIFRSLKEHLL